MNRLVKALKELAKAIGYPYKPRSKENYVWKRFKEKEARSYFERGLYSLDEYNKRIKEINREYEQNNHTKRRA